MNKYTVTTVLTLPAGSVLGLSPQQAAARSHALKPLRGKRYETTGPVQFKVGESIDFEGELPKHLADLVEKPKAEKPAGKGSDLREDGPTVAEYVAAGYRAENYPPDGYASKSTPDEIAAAIAEQAKAKA